MLRNCIMFIHVFLKIIALLQTPRPDPEGSMTRIMKAWTLGHPVNIRSEHHLHALAGCSRGFPRREWPGVKTRSRLYQCNVLGKTDQKKFSSLQSGIKAGLRVDSAPQSNKGCWSPDPLHQISCFIFILVAHSWTFRATMSSTHF